jgi:pyroglutamyl-peptidase
MEKKILLTSFDTRLSQQQSNSADDLLLQLAKMADFSHDLTFSQPLPIDVALASSPVIAKIMNSNLIMLSVVVWLLVVKI